MQLLEMGREGGGWISHPTALLALIGKGLVGALAASSCCCSAFFHPIPGAEMDMKPKAPQFSPSSPTAAAPDAGCAGAGDLQGMDPPAKKSLRSSRGACRRPCCACTDAVSISTMFIISLLNEPPLLWVPLNLSPSLLPALRSVSFFQERGCSMEIAPVCERVCVCAHVCSAPVPLIFSTQAYHTPVDTGFIFCLPCSGGALSPLAHVIPLGLGL